MQKNKNDLTVGDFIVKKVDGKLAMMLLNKELISKNWIFVGFNKLGQQIYKIQSKI